MQVRESGALNAVDQKGSGLPKKQLDMGSMEKIACLCTKMSTEQKVAVSCTQVVLFQMQVRT